MLIVRYYIFFTFQTLGLLSDRLYDVSVVFAKSKKPKVMIFERERYTSCELFLNNDKFEMADSLKDLGVRFFMNGNWFRTQKRLAQHATYALRIFLHFSDK